MIPYNEIIYKFGDLSYDLIRSLVGNEEAAEEVMRVALRNIKKNLSPDLVQSMARAWTLREVYLCLVEKFEKNRIQPVDEESFKIEVEVDPNKKLEGGFEVFFQRLSPEDQSVLLLRDKLGLPYDEISVVLGVTKQHVMTRRRISLSLLEDRIWGGYESV